MASSKPDAKKSPILSRIPRPTHENIYTVPNILTFSRLVAAPLVGYFLVHDHHAAALGLFAYAGITDLIDGYIARRYSLQTVVGTIIDPMADKLLMTIGVACLAVNGSIPGALCASCLPSTLTEPSLARCHHSWPRHWSCPVCHLLSLDFSSATEDHGPLLGFLAAIRRGETHGDLENQHCPAASARW